MDYRSVKFNLKKQQKESREDWGGNRINSTETSKTMKKKETLFSILYGDVQKIQVEHKAVKHGMVCQKPQETQLKQMPSPAAEME